MAKTYETKTKPTDIRVDDFLAAVTNERRHADGFRLREIMEEITGEPAVMWGPSIVGFGSYHYCYATGHEGDAPKIGFAPRSANLVLYILGDFDGQDDLLARLGKHKTSKACLYITRLSDIDESVLREMIERSFAHSARLHVEA